jgi:hypothetical protein
MIKGAGEPGQTSHYSGISKMLTIGHYPNEKYQRAEMQLMADLKILVNITSRTRIWLCISIFVLSQLRMPAFVTSSHENELASVCP